MFVRIAFYAPLKAPTHPIPSGDRRMARLLMAALAASGHQVTLASRFRSWDDARRPGRAERLAVLGRRCATRLITRLAPTPPDLWFTYHLYHKAPDWLGPAVSAAFNIPYVVAEASVAGKRAAGPFATGHRAALAALAQADSVIALTDVDLAGLAAVVSPTKPLVRLKPFLDVAPFAFAADARAGHRADLARALDLPIGAPWLVAVAMMRGGDKERSYAVLAEALGRLLDRDWRLIVVGDGPARAAVEAGFARLPPARRRFTGRLGAEDLARVYAAGDIMVWPAVNEAYGMALLEAQAAGLPVVAGLSGGVGEVVADQRTGLLVPVGDAPAFAGALAALLDDPERGRAMGGQARAKAAAEHGLEAAATLLDHAIRAAAARKGAT